MLPHEHRTLIQALPKGFAYTGLLILSLMLVPPALILRARAVPTDSRRIHIIQNMDNQPKYVDQQENILFADQRSMRPQVPGTVSRSQMVGDTHWFLGTVDGDFATEFPSQLTIDEDLLKRGHVEFEIYCLPCHGVKAEGDGVIHGRAMVLMNVGTNGTTWVQPKNLHEEAIAEQPVGKIFWTISNGIRNMAGYASQIRVEDRWAIVAWVKALQISENAPSEHVPGADTLPVETKQVPGEEETP
jgi:mono/diheme cytochrome c family protein